MQSHLVVLNGVNIHPFPSVQHLLDYVDQTKGLLVAINAERSSMRLIRCVLLLIEISDTVMGQGRCWH